MLIPFSFCSLFFFHLLFFLMSWAELPSEILQQITKILGRDLSQFRLTCNWWYQQAYDFPYHQFKVTGNVFEFTDIISKSPCHPGDIVRSITFTDDFAISDFNGRLKQIVDTIFRACPTIDSIHCSPLASTATRRGFKA